jgi:hypothetical protein
LPHHLKFRILEERLAVCRLEPAARIPTWALEGKFFCVVRTADELSVVCSEEMVPEITVAERGWVALKLEGLFPFSLSGVLAAFAQPLARSCIGIFAISTFDTDYILIKKDDCDAALAALQKAGHENLVKVPNKEQIKRTDEGDSL